MKNAKKETLQLDFGFDSVVVKKTPDKDEKSKQKVDFVFDMMDCLSSPVIVFPGPWRDAIPKDLLDTITLSRLFCLMKGEQMASFPEVVAYMMPRTFESPMAGEWVNIYTWAGAQYFGMFKEGNKQFEGIAPEQLSDYEQDLLNKLRKWIYDKRRGALKTKMSTEKKQRKPSLAGDENNQQDLFD